jgi:two-component system, LytTR family, sensor kinase
MNHEFLKNLFKALMIFLICYYLLPTAILTAEEEINELPYNIINNHSFDYTDRDLKPEDLSLYSGWEPAALFAPGKSGQNNNLWLRIPLPQLLWDNPALIITSFLEKFIIYDSGQEIYRYPDTHEFRYYNNHLIPLDSNNATGYIYLNLSYSDAAGIGEIFSIFIGPRSDIIQAAASRKEDIYRSSIIETCQGSLLFAIGTACLLIFFLRWQEKESLFFSFGLFSLFTGVTYLSDITPLSIFNISPPTLFYLKTLSFLLVPVGLFAFVEGLFGKGRLMLLRAIWIYHLVFTILAPVLIKFNIDYSYFYFISLIINCSLSIYLILKSRSETDLKIKISFIAFFILFIFLTIIQFLNMLNLIPLTYDLFGWGMLIFVFSLGYILIQHYQNTFKKIQNVSLELAQNKSEILEMQKEKLSSQLEALKNQLDPHFLFNNLSTLSSIIEDNQETAVNFVNELSMIYRYVLQTKKQTLIKLSEELDFIKSYYFLMSKRFGDNLLLAINIQATLKNNKILPFSLQLLVENAIKHNIISKKRPLTIEIFTQDNEYLVVKNNLQAKTLTVASTNIGLANITSRYRLITKKPVSIIKSDSEFTVKIPLLKNKPAQDQHPPASLQDQP